MCSVTNFYYVLFVHAMCIERHHNSIKTSKILNVVFAAAHSVSHVHTYLARCLSTSTPNNLMLGASD